MLRQGPPSRGSSRRVVGASYKKPLPTPEPPIDENRLTRVRFSTPIEMPPTPSTISSSSSMRTCSSKSSLRSPASTPPSSVAPSRQTSLDSTCPSYISHSSTSIIGVPYQPPSHGFGVRFSGVPKRQRKRGWSTSSSIKAETLQLEKGTPLKYETRRWRKAFDQRIDEMWHWSFCIARDVTIAAAALPISLVPQPDDPLQMTDAKAALFNVTVMTPVCLTVLFVAPPALCVAGLLSPLLAPRFEADE